MNVLETWKDLQVRLKALKEEEADTRRSLCSEIIADAPMKNGRTTVRSVMYGYPVKAVQTLSYSLDLAVLGNIWDSLSPVERAAVKMKPTLQEGKYKKLPEDSILHEAVVTRLGMPTLDVGDLS